MNKPRTINVYSPLEEGLNIFTHGLGIIMSLVAGMLMFKKTLGQEGWLPDVSILIFSTSMFILYTASTLYHSARKQVIRYRLNILDHAAIYVLIAGSYTPFSLITLKGTWGTVIMIVVWTIAIGGVILKLRFTGRYQKLSTLSYILMGWIVVIAIGPLVNKLETEGLYLLFAGGLCYTLGAVIFSIKKIPLNHAIFHVFVLGGSLCHIYCVYNYVI